MNQPAVETSSGRTGGRSARRAKRAAPLEKSQRPIWPGMRRSARGPLTEAGIERIHQAILEVLETIGFGEAPAFTVETLTAAGAIHDSETGRIRFPRSLVEDAIANANRDFVWHARDPERSIEPCADRLYFGTGGAAVHLVDLENREYRESTVRDLYDAARIADLCDNVHFFQRPMVARDMDTPLLLDLNTAYACLAGTNKHMGMSFTDGATYDHCLEFLHMVAGGEEAWRRAPFVSNGNCFVVPPLKFAHDSCEVLERAARTGTPILALSAGQAGATAPAAIAGAVTQGYAEALVGMIYVNAIQPRSPVVLGAWPFVSDLRSGAMSGGSSEQSLLSAACGQMGQHYGLPTGSAAGMADAKLPDAQSGYEKGMTVSMAGLSGINMVYESVGMQASLLGFSPESLIIDNDLAGASLRLARGIEVTDENCSVDTIREVCIGGPGHYLGTGQTLSLMQSEYCYPELGDRSSPKEWAEIGKPDIVMLAKQRKKEILEGYFPDHINEELDGRIREAFDIRLPREVMRPA